MKKIMILMTLLPLMAFSCKDESVQTQSTCEGTCNDSNILEELSNTPAKIITVCTDIDENGNYINCIYAISTDEEWLDKDNWPEPSDNILVPCNNIPEELRKVNLKVLISGLKRSCCDLLTKPEFRSSFGCEFEITSIEKQDTIKNSY